MKPDWITLDKTSGTGGVETVNISAMGNMGEERASQIVAKTANGGQATLNIAQAGVPIVGAVRIQDDVSSLISVVSFEENYGISYPVIVYRIGEAASEQSATFSARFNIDAKYIHDVVNYLADTYPEGMWYKNNPVLVMTWSTPTGNYTTKYPNVIPETGRIFLAKSSNPAAKLYIHDGSNITVSVSNGNSSIHVNLYKIYFIN